MHPHRHPGGARADARAASGVQPDENALEERRNRITMPAPADVATLARECVDPGFEVSERPTEPAPPDPKRSTTRLRAGAPSASREDIARIRFELADRYTAGDYAAALPLAEELAQKLPGDAAAQVFADDCRARVEAALLRRLGSLDRVPELLVPLEDLRRVDLDHRAGFLLSRIDGSSPLEELLDVVAMPRAEALGLVEQLLKASVIKLRDA